MSSTPKAAKTMKLHLRVKSLQRAPFRTLPLNSPPTFSFQAATCETGTGARGFAEKQSSIYLEMTYVLTQESAGLERVNQAGRGVGCSLMDMNLEFRGVSSDLERVSDKHWRTGGWRGPTEGAGRAWPPPPQNVSSHRPGA